MKGDGTVYRRGAIFWIAYWRGGKQYRESAGTEAQAKKLLRRRQAEIQSDRFVGPTEERVTIGQLLDALVVHAQTNEDRSIRTMASQIKPVRAFFGDLRAIGLTAAHVERYQKGRLDDEMANGTINREIGILRRSLHLAERQGRLNRVPYIPMLPERNVRQGFFEADEFASVLRHLPNAIADAASFAYKTGWRKGEVVSLRWEQVDRNAREVRLPMTKNGRPRSLPLEGELWDLIEARWEARDYLTPAGTSALSEFVFHRAGKPLGDFRKAWQAACVTAGVGRYLRDGDGKIVGYEGKLFHDFRRTAARNLIRSGVSETVAMSITGHLTRSMFDRYNVTSEEDKRDALRKTEARRNASSGNVVSLDRHRTVTK